MLTEGQLETIRQERGDDPIIGQLLDEIERLADQLSDCWLRLDSAARGEPIQIAAIHLLKQQKVPGWK